MDDCRWWTVPGNVAAAVAARLPGALIGGAMLVTFAGILGPTWGGAVALAPLAAGALVLTRRGERLAATTVLRYRPAPGSWLVLQAATVSAVAELRAGRTWPELAMGWWSGPWLFAKMTVGVPAPELAPLLPARRRRHGRRVGGHLPAPRPARRCRTGCVHARRRRSGLPRPPPGALPGGARFPPSPAPDRIPSQQQHDVQGGSAQCPRSSTPARCSPSASASSGGGPLTGAGGAGRFGPRTARRRLRAGVVHDGAARGLSPMLVVPGSLPADERGWADELKIDVASHTNGRTESARQADHQPGLRRPLRRRRPRLIMITPGPIEHVLPHERTKAGDH